MRYAPKCAPIAGCKGHFSHYPHPHTLVLVKERGGSEAFSRCTNRPPEDRKYIFSEIFF